jgi:N-acetyl-anhydromuramyl-L-alanine amidase AmpD
MTIEERLIKVNFTAGGNKKLGIVIHTMVGSLAGTDSWFNNPASAVSAHYGVSLDGTLVYQWVKEDDQAYAQGIVNNPTFEMVLDRPGINPNTYLISIECADNGNPAGADRSLQLPTIIKLVQAIASRNHISIDADHICGHHQIRADKTCPGNLDVNYIIKQAQVGGPIMSDMYTLPSGAQLDLANRDSNIVTAKQWDEVVNQHLWIRKTDADAASAVRYAQGFADGKAQAGTGVDLNMWTENGLTVETTEGSKKTILNYKLK